MISHYFSKDFSKQNSAKLSERQMQMQKFSSLVIRFYSNSKLVQ